MNLLYKDESYKIIGACMTVHKELGCGFLEAIYQESLAIELTQLKIPFQQEKQLTVAYKGNILTKHYIADFICYEKIILEIKALSTLTSDHEAQVLNYLKATGFKLGILLNFGEESLVYKRLVL